MVPKFRVMGKKRSLCKIQSNFNRCDKILPNNVQLCPDSAAAGTFITTDQETLRPVKLYFLPCVLVVTKLTSDSQREQPKDELVLKAQQCLRDCRDGSGESQSFLCAFLIPWVSYYPLCLLPSLNRFYIENKIPNSYLIPPNQDLNIFEDWPLSAKKPC